MGSCMCFPLGCRFWYRFIEQPKVIEKVLSHVGLWSALPWKGSRRWSEDARRQKWGICSHCGRTCTAKHIEHHRENGFRPGPQPRY
jgi:hypothetical protein